MSAEFEPSAPLLSPASRSRKAILGWLLGVSVAIPAAAWLWGYMVDDALITARVAAHIAQGLGPRFNPRGPLTDAVTPLGYAQLLAPLGGGDTWHTFVAAKWLGLVAWLAASGLLGVSIARAGQRKRRFTPLGIVLLSAPLAAWAVSGMETGVVTLLATLGLLEGPLAALALGAAAAWRPELVPFAAVLVSGRLLVARPAARRVLAELACLLVPALCIALARWLAFGRAVPLSFYAKPSDFAHGLRYALGAFAFTGLPWLLLGGPRELSAVPRAARPLFVAFAVHLFALVLCGGDWMTLYRLVVPALPCAALAAAYLAEQARPLWLGLRLFIATASALLLAFGLGRSARRVGAERMALIAAARPVLARDPRIAALDVGWVGAARDAEVIDLAGVTDPEVAAFPGGHTSKAIPKAWLFKRAPTAIVLLLADGELQDSFEWSWYSRAVEERIAHTVGADFKVRTTLALGQQKYVLLEPR